MSRAKNSDIDLQFYKRANCRDMDEITKDLFFEVDKTSIAMAKEICLACPVMADCLALALMNHESAGVWGGLDTEERHEIARRGRRAQAGLEDYNA